MEKKKIVKEPISDSLVSKPPVYKDPAKILRAGQFHEGEVWPEKNQWAYTEPWAADHIRKRQGLLGGAGKSGEANSRL